MRQDLAKNWVVAGAVVRLAAGPGGDEAEKSPGVCQPWAAAAAGPRSSDNGNLKRIRLRRRSAARSGIRPNPYIVGAREVGVPPSGRRRHRRDGAAAGGCD